MSAPPDDVLLCERCGYVLEGLPVEGKCPECGRGIAESTWANHIGTSWERTPTRKNWPKAALAVITKPQEEFESIRPDSASLLHMFNAVAAGAIIAIVPAMAAGFGMLLGSNTIINQNVVVSGLLAVLTGISIALATGVLVWSLSTCLIWISYPVVTSSAQRNRWRIRKDLFICIAEHASAGWLVGPIVMTGLRLLGLSPSIAFPAGMLVAPLGFLYYLYLGILTCRYANGPLTASKARAAGRTTGAARPA